ncbi:hypothetical protein BC629DRAFT_1687266 [Irpex lacteus]|nr:hypothetical protein BC629DRAFT_1687266 [Irpex lacteus]
MFSDNDLEVVRWLLQTAEVANPPSVWQIKEQRRELDRLCAPSVNRHVGTMGHTYYVVSVGELAAMNCSNPTIREHLHFYPEATEHCLNEARQGNKWLNEADPTLLTPMYTVDKTDFYIFEPALLKNHILCIPHRFFTQNGTILGNQLSAWVYPLPNPWRVKARGHKVLSMPFWLYCDDTSGNRSKKWNEHNSFLMIPAGLPHELVCRESSIQFLCTSNAAPPLEMLDGISEEFSKAQEDGVWAYDCATRQLVLLIIWVLALLGDNPMQSELACHAGLNARCFCRVCMAKGREGRLEDEPADSIGGAGSSSHAGQQSREPLDAMVNHVRQFVQGNEARASERTRAISEETWRNFLTGAAQRVNLELQRNTGIKDRYLAYFLQSLPKNIYNPVWRLKSLDPHRDTPVEILHVVLLGIIKYFWRDAVARLSPAQLQILKTRLASMNLRGLDPSLTSLNGQTFVQYARSLVGRDFRVIVQVALFALYDLVPPPVYEAWVALAALVPLIYMPSIEDRILHTQKIRRHVTYLLVATARWTVRWFNKPKFHLLIHLHEHVLRFGPAILFSTESLESYNAVIRAWSVNSNRQAPSRDCANRAASLARVRHLLSGGYYTEKGSVTDRSMQTSWQTAGSAVIKLLASPSILMRRLGLTCSTDSCKPEPGVVTQAEDAPIPWSQTIAACASTTDDAHREVRTEMQHNTTRTFKKCTSVIIGNGDKVALNEFVVVCHSAGNFRTGRVIEILRNNRSFTLTASLIVVELFDINGAAWPYQMPRIATSGTHVLVEDIQTLVCSVNVQHNCANNGCDLSDTRTVYLEREQQAERAAAVHHLNPDDLVLNTAKMRDARFVQTFAISPPDVNLDSVLVAACRAEFNR